MRKILCSGINIELDEECKVLTVEGCPISFDLFKSWGIHGMPVGAIFRIVQRDEDGRLTVERLDKARD